MGRSGKYVKVILILGLVYCITTLMLDCLTYLSNRGLDTPHRTSERDQDLAAPNPFSDDFFSGSHELNREQHGRPVSNILRNEDSFFTSHGKEYTLEEEVPWLNRSTCKPAKNIAFLKIHKCASSTVQNMLMRYGSKHGLLFAMPARSHIFPLRVPFQASMVHDGANFHTEKSNIFAMHAIWNKEEIFKVLYSNAVSFTIVREPTEAFMSLFDYFAFQRLYKMPLDKFVASYGIEMKRLMGCVSYNIIACDMGAQPKDYINPKAIKLLAFRADMEFDLVIIAERFEESLVLLKQLLCWSYEDMVVINVNTRLRKRDKLTAAVSDMLKERLKPDYYIYNYFYKKFDMLVKVFGEKRMEEELNELRRVTKSKIESCNIVKKKPPIRKGPEKAGASKVEQMVTNSTDPFCKNLVMSEQTFVSNLKKKQAQIIEKSEKDNEFIKN